MVNEVNETNISKGRIILIALLYALLDMISELVVLIPQMIQEMKHLIETNQTINAEQGFSDYLDTISYPWYGNVIKFGIIVLIVYLLKRQGVDFFKIPDELKTHWREITGSIIVCLAVNFLLDELILWIHPQFDTANQMSLEAMFVNSSAITMFLMIVVLAPITEEIMIRGVFIGVLFKEKPYLSQFHN